jgi:hypothetical protein
MVASIHEHLRLRQSPDAGTIIVHILHPPSACPQNLPQLICTQKEEWYYNRSGDVVCMSVANWVCRYLRSWSFMLTITRVLLSVQQQALIARSLFVGAHIETLCSDIVQGHLYQGRLERLLTHDGDSIPMIDFSRHLWRHEIMPTHSWLSSEWLATRTTAILQLS